MRLHLHKETERPVSRVEVCCGIPRVRRQSRIPEVGKRSGAAKVPPEVCCQQLVAGPTGEHRVGGRQVNRVVSQFAPVGVGVLNCHERRLAVDGNLSVRRNEVRRADHHSRQRFRSHIFGERQLKLFVNRSVKVRGGHCCDSNTERRDRAFQNIPNFHHPEITGGRCRVILGAEAGREILHHHVRLGCIHSRTDHQRANISAEENSLGGLEVFLFCCDSVRLVTDRRIHRRVRNCGCIEQNRLAHCLVKSRGDHLRSRPCRAMHCIHLHDSRVHDASCIQHRVNDG